MREIKFRQLVRGSRFVGGTPDNPKIESGGLLWHYFGFVNGGFASPVSYVETETIGQFTGLKDKNGVEIYEGDIVKADDDFIYVVEFQDGAWTLVDKSAGQKDGVFHSVWASVSEVIGNIHENPELLKV